MIVVYLYGSFYVQRIAMRGGIFGKRKGTAIPAIPWGYVKKEAGRPDTGKPSPLLFLKTMLAKT